MRVKTNELDVDFIGGGRPFTKEDEIAISNFIRAYKAKQTPKHSGTKRTIKPSLHKRKLLRNL